MNAQLLFVLAFIALTGGQETIREQVKRSTDGLGAQRREPFVGR